MPTLDVENWMKYCNSIAQEFEAKRSRIRNFVTDHNLTTGNANEAILRSFLGNLLPGSYKATQGFICNPVVTDAVSKQCDIIVYDCEKYPAVHTEGEISIVWPESVTTVIEVKTNMQGRDDIHGAIDNVSVAKQLNSMITGFIFAFDSLGTDSVVKHLREYPHILPMHLAPNGIFLFEKKTLITTGRMRLPGREKDTYTVYEFGDKGILIAYLVLFLLSVTVNRTQLEAVTMNMASVIHHTSFSNANILAEGLKIGDLSNQSIE